MSEPAAEAPRPTRAPRRVSIRVVIQLLLTSAVVLFAGRTLWRQWVEVDRVGRVWDVQPGWIAASSLVVLAVYALLIETWRQTLASWGARVGFMDAARVWSVSNLGKYVPGKVWQVSAMAVMMQRLGVSLAVAGASAVLITIANLAAGFGVVSLFGAGAVANSRSAYIFSIVLLVLTVAMLAVAPLFAPRLAALGERVSGFTMPRMVVPTRAPWISAAGCLVGWIGYGIAFRLFTVGVLGHAPGATSAYIAAFTGSYLLGYIALFAPGGVGVRELALATALPALGLATPAEATLVTVASRLWLTVLEILPGLLFLAARRGAGK